MKNIKKIIALGFCIFISHAVFAQKLWLSAGHENNQLSYYKNGKTEQVKAIWTGGEARNGRVVVYGEFKRDYNNNIYFEIEKSHASTTLLSGTFYNSKFKCDIPGGSNGYLQNGDQKTWVTVRNNVTSNQWIESTQAYWGIMECNGTIFSIYYIYNHEDNSYARVVEQTYNGENGTSSSSSSNSTKVITGKIIKRNTSKDLDVPNWATFQTSDGGYYEISSPSPISSNGTITLEGYTKQTYYNGIMKVEDVFYVTKVR